MGSTVVVRTLVLGAGVTGRSVARVLESRGDVVAMLDENRSGSDFISPDQIDSQSWDRAIVSPGWRSDHPIVRRVSDLGISLVSEIDLAWGIRNEIAPNQRWIAVTGTNGKTSTVELTTAILKEAGLHATACGNVGDTVIEAVVSSEKWDFLVVELSSFQLYWSELPEFSASAILNIADDHVDWHGTFDDYTAAKIKILERCDVALLNADDPTVVGATQHCSGKKVFFSLDTPSPGELGLVENLLIDRAFVPDQQEASVIAELLDVHPSAPHSVSNALAAAGLARALGVPHEVIQRGIKNFRPGRHRIEMIANVAGVSWIDDSKATNPHAAAASLASQLSVIWIAGGLAKGASMQSLVARTKGRLKAALLIGTDRDLIANELRNQAPNVPIYFVDEDSSASHSLMENVVLRAKDIAAAGDAVMLAPACASMDQFVDYSDRGDQFSAAVQKLVVGA